MDIAAYVSELLQISARDPIELGYAFRHWNAHRLAQHLAKTKRIIVSEHQVAMILHKKSQYSFRNQTIQK